MGSERNTPCPCGSGRKYKQCCLKRQKAEEATARTEAGERSRLAESAAHAAVRILRWAQTQSDEPVAALAGMGGEGMEDLIVTLGAYVLGPSEKQSWFHAFRESGGRLPPDQLACAEAQEPAWLGLWRVLDVVPGHSMRLKDLLTGEEREVWERMASQSLRLHDHLMARVIEVGDRVLLGAMHPIALTPFDAETLHAELREALHEACRLPRKRPLKPAELRGAAATMTTLMQMEAMVERMRTRGRPRLQNTDGEPIALTELRYELDDSSATIEALLALEGVQDNTGEGEAPHSNLAFVREGNAQHKSWESTMLGKLTRAPGRVTLDVNSSARADLLDARLRAGLGDRIRLVDRVERSADEIFAQGPSRSGPRLEAAPPPEVQAAIQRTLAGHYESWPDEPLPALQGKTPRAAVKTKQGRHALDVLLRDMASQDSRLPEWQRFDFDSLRERLGLGPASEI